MYSTVRGQYSCQVYSSESSIQLSGVQYSERSLQQSGVQYSEKSGYSTVRGQVTVQ